MECSKDWREIKCCHLVVFIMLITIIALYIFFGRNLRVQLTHHKSHLHCGSRSFWSRSFGSGTLRSRSFGSGTLRSRSFGSGTLRSRSYFASDPKDRDRNVPDLNDRDQNDRTRYIALNETVLVQFVDLDCTNANPRNCLWELRNVD